MDWLHGISDRPTAIKTAATAGILLLVLIARRLAIRTFESSGLPAHRRNRFLVQSRNAAILAFLGAAVVLWAEQLQTVALSVAALAAAMVIATKELILCMSGTLLRVSAQAFRLGDRIQVRGSRGDVIDIGPLTTTLLEVGPEPFIHKLTGRKIVLPNALFLTEPVFNETFTEQCVLHTTAVDVQMTGEHAQDWRAVEQLLLAAADTVCGPHLNDARLNMERIGRKHGLEPPDVTPKVWVRLNPDTSVSLMLRYPAPIRGRGQTEQAILRGFLQRRDVNADSAALKP